MGNTTKLSSSSKASIIFVALCYSLTITCLLVVKNLHLPLQNGMAVFDQAMIGLAMFFPGISALLVQKLYLHRRIRDLGFRWGNLRSYISVYGAIFGIFIVNYLITYLFVQKPDLSLQSFVDLIAPGEKLPISAGLMIFLFAFMTLFLSPIFNMIPSLGEEIGWRGFLLANLEPLGKVKASILSSVAWALWHTPMILIMGFGYGKQVFPGIIIHFFIVTGLGIFIAYYWFKTRSTILAAFMHSLVNANSYGVWTLIFVNKNKALVGPIGIINGVIITIIGIYMAIKISKDRDLTTAST